MTIWGNIPEPESAVDVELPQLPDETSLGNDYTRSSVYGYTDEQMQDYARQAIAAALAKQAGQAELVDACGRYEVALLTAFPNGANGAVFEQWNEARKLLAKRDARTQAAQQQQ